MAGLQMAGIRIRTFLACDCATMRGRGPRFFTCLASAFFANSSSMKDRQRDWALCCTIVHVWKQIIGLVKGFGASRRFGEKGFDTQIEAFIGSNRVT
ncbi:hypothetical protein NC652_036484 [Populus alba x Populus x berolinensis]|nr:hypothetical protein NC652_036484 [Populus alba x Populus x berolinensis]